MYSQPFTQIFYLCIKTGDNGSNKRAANANEKNKGIAQQSVHTMDRPDSKQSNNSVLNFVP